MAFLELAVELLDGGDEKDALAPEEVSSDEEEHDQSDVRFVVRIDSRVAREEKQVDHGHDHDLAHETAVVLAQNSEGVVDTEHGDDEDGGKGHEQHLADNVVLQEDHRVDEDQEADLVDDGVAESPPAPDFVAELLVDVSASLFLLLFIELVAFMHQLEKDSDGNELDYVDHQADDRQDEACVVGHLLIDRSLDVDHSH